MRAVSSGRATHMQLHLSFPSFSLALHCFTPMSDSSSGCCSNICSNSTSRASEENMAKCKCKSWDLHISILTHVVRRRLNISSRRFWGTFVLLFSSAAGGSNLRHQNRQTCGFHMHNWSQLTVLSVCTVLLWFPFLCRLALDSLNESWDVSSGHEKHLQMLK